MLLCRDEDVPCIEQLIWCFETESYAETVCAQSVTSAGTENAVCKLKPCLSRILGDAHDKHVNACLFAISVCYFNNGFLCSRMKKSRTVTRTHDTRHTQTQAQHTQRAH